MRTSATVAPAPEQRELEVRFIPITCAAPLLYAERGGFFERNGLSVRLRPATGWSAIKELLVHGRADAAHVLSPMPFASSLGVDGRPAALRLCLVQNVNGQAITLARRHAGVTDPRAMKGFVFGVPYLYSMQHYLLCDWLARHGVNPLADVRIEEVSPQLMPYYLRKGRLDAMLAPEPYNEIAVEEGLGQVIAFSSEMWPGHPCCAFAATQAAVEERPATFRALARSVIEAQRAIREATPERREEIAREIADVAGWRGHRADAAARVLAGVHRDESGALREVPHRIDFLPYVPEGFAVWIASQMQRWGQLPADAEVQRAAIDVLWVDAAREASLKMGLPAIDPAAAGLEPLEAAGALAAVRAQPFSALQEAAAPVRRYDLPEPVRERLGAMLHWLAGVASGESEEPLAISSADEIGWMEAMLNEAVQNARFLRELMDERFTMEEEARRQEAVIAAQGEMIRALSTPILPVLPGLLVMPIVGVVDAERADRIMATLLAEIERSGAEMVLLDLTGVDALGMEVLSCLVRVIQAASLLGAHCLLVGVRAPVAHALAQVGPELPEISTARDLQSGVALAMRHGARQAAAARGLTSRAAPRG